MKRKMAAKMAKIAAAASKWRNGDGISKKQKQRKYRKAVAKYLSQRNGESVAKERRNERRKSVENERRHHGAG